jgi:hypothetical protein
VVLDEDLRESHEGSHVPTAPPRCRTAVTSGMRRCTSNIGR